MLGSAALAPGAALRSVRTPDVRPSLSLVRAIAAVRARGAKRLLGRRATSGSASSTRSSTRAGTASARDMGVAHGAARLARRRRSRSARRSCRCRCRRSANAQRGYNQSERLVARAGRIGGGSQCGTDVLDAHAAHRDADAVDTRGPTPQRFGRVLGASDAAERASRRASHARR